MGHGKLMGISNIRVWTVFLFLFSGLSSGGFAFADDISSKPLERDNAVQAQPPAAKDGALASEEPSSAAAAAAVSSEADIKVRGEANDLSRRVDPTQADVTNNGAFSYRYDIAVAPFRGLEPKLTLNYNSARKTKTGGDYQGWLGYGWGLSGVPVIERAGYLQGVPHYTDDDIYLLNGQALAKCNGAGASCVAGGNWVPEVENYLKVNFNKSDASNPIWEVTARDGTKTTFTSVGKIAASSATVPGDINNDVKLNYRWLATSVTDTVGNKVVYGYSCPQLPVCYPINITYYNFGATSGAQSIEIYYDKRPDYITSGNGHTISEISQRIKTILTKTGSAITAGYKISYEQAPLSDASRLIAIQKFGSNLQLDSAKTILDDSTPGTTSLPKTTFNYNNSTGFAGGQDIAGVTGMPYRDKLYKRLVAGQTSTYENKLQRFDSLSAFDVNSDGITEIIRKRFVTQNTSTCTYQLFSLGSGNAYSPLALPDAKCTQLVLSGDPFTATRTGSGFTVGRLATDRKQTQLLFMDDSDQANDPIIRWQMTLTKSNNAFTAIVKSCQAASTAANAVTDSYIRALCDNRYPAVYPFDKNGDGRDLLSTITKGKGNFFGDSREQAIGWSGSKTTLLAYQGSADKTFEVGNVLCQNNCVYLDLNGDGLDDLVKFSGGVGQQSAFYSSFLFSGDKFIALIENEGVNAGAATFVSDVDGDGKAELGLGVIPSNDDQPYQSGYEPRSWKYLFHKHSESYRGFTSKALPSSASGMSFITPGDFNGDGQTDLLVAPPTTVTPNQFTARDNTGQMAFDSAGYAKALYESYLTRVYQIRYGGASNGVSSSGGIANLLNAITNAQGGQLNVAYAPSTAYENDYLPYSLPTVSALSSSDGRGQTATTGYAYASGLYDINKQRFLGFGTVTKTLPKIAGETTGPVVKTTYRQTIATIGLPSKTESLDSNGALQRAVSESYAINATTVPYTAQNTETTTAITVGSATRTIKTARTFDGYGNITEELDYGRVDASGDEVFSNSSFVPNKVAYIVSLPSWTRLYRGTSSSGQLLKASDFGYDNQSVGTAPTRGKLNDRSDYKNAGTTQRNTFTYDAFGNVATSTNGENETTSYEYDATYRLFVTKTIYPSGLVETAVPNAACSGPATKTGLNGAVISYTYDVFCRPVRVQNEATGSYTETAYQVFGNPADQRIRTTASLPNSANPSAQYQYFDGLGRTWRAVVGGDGSSPTSYVDTEYDLRGNAFRVSLPYETGTPLWTTTIFDWANRPTKVTNPDTTYKSYAYGLQDSISVSDNLPLEYTKVTDEEQGSVYTYTSAAGDMIGKWQSAPASDGTYLNRWLNGATFDGAHRLIGAKDQSGASWSYTYDLMGNRLTANDPDLGNWAYVYDAANRLKQQTDARGSVTSITYNKDGQPLKTVAGETILAENIYNEERAGYYNKGLLTTSRNSATTQSLDYNADGLMQKKAVLIDTVNHIEETGYDAGRQPIWKAYGPTASALNVGAASSKWGYNRKGQLLSIPGYITSTTYELDGQTTSITYANGVVTTFTYEPRRRWLTGFTTQKDGTIIIDGTYGRDKTGRILSIDASGTANDWVYTYDAFGRIAKAARAGDPASTETFAYADNDNLLTRSSLPGAFAYPSASAARPHAPLSLNGVDFSYDANGNLETDRQGTTTTADDRVFTYDLANRVSKVHTNANNADVNLVYGPDGARVKKSSPYGATLYPDAAAEFDTPTQVFTRYPHMDIKVVGTTKYFLHRDHLSSVRAVTDQNGAIVESTRYAVYGESANKAMTTQKNYIGERFDAETGLLYLNARYMDPKFGRFISPDDWDPTTK